MRFPPRRYATALSLLGLMALIGCTSDKDNSPNDPVQPVPITAHAVLDNANATIALPLQKFGMTHSERQYAGAASAIVLARCVAGGGEVNATALQNVRTFLKSPPREFPQWLFGYWDAEYIAAHGVQSPPSTFPRSVKTDPATGKRCAQKDEYAAVQPISTSDGTSQEYAALIKYTSESAEKTHRDPRYIELRTDFAKCVKAKGYTADSGSELASLKVEPSWSSEEQLKAALAEASCNDELRLTQQAGDIQASYEREYIEAHEAELATIKQAADKHVAKAKTILREAGLV